MWPFEAMGAFVLVLAMLAVLFVIFLLRRQRSDQDLPLWFSASVGGVLLGAAGVAAGASALGYRWVKDVPDVAGGPVAAAAPAGGMPGGPGGMGGGGPPGGMGGGMMGGGGMGGGMMGGGGRGPSPKTQLTSLVRKLDLLTGDISIQLNAEQSAAIATTLDELKASPTLTDEEATAKYDKLLALLDDSQKAKQDAIGLPFRRGGGRGGSGGPGGSGAPGGPGGAPGGPGGGGPPAPDANPFASDENSAALNSLLARVGGEKASDADSEKAKPASSEATPEPTSEADGRANAPAVTLEEKK